MTQTPSAPVLRPAGGKHSGSRCAIASGNLGQSLHFHGQHCTQQNTDETKVISQLGDAMSCSLHAAQPGPVCPQCHADGCLQDAQFLAGRPAQVVGRPVADFRPALLGKAARCAAAARRPPPAQRPRTRSRPAQASREPRPATRRPGYRRVTCGRPRGSPLSASRIRAEPLSNTGTVPSATRTRSQKCFPSRQTSQP